MPKPDIPPGYALVRITDLAAAARPAAEPPRPTGLAWEGLSIAVAMLTAALGRHDVDLGELADGGDSLSIIRVLVILAAAGLPNSLSAGSAASLLRDLGEIAAFRGRGQDGRPL